MTQLALVKDVVRTSQQRCEIIMSLTPILQTRTLRPEPNS